MTSQNVPPENETSPPDPTPARPGAAQPSGARDSPPQAGPLDEPVAGTPEPGSEPLSAADADDPTDSARRMRLDVSYPHAEAAVLAVTGEIDAGTSSR